MLKLAVLVVGPGALEKSALSEDSNTGSFHWFNRDCWLDGAV